MFFSPHFLCIADGLYSLKFLFKQTTRMHQTIVWEMSQKEWSHEWSPHCAPLFGLKWLVIDSSCFFTLRTGPQRPPVLLCGLWSPGRLCSRHREWTEVPSLLRKGNSGRNDGPWASALEETHPGELRRPAQEGAAVCPVVEAFWLHQDQRLKPSAPFISYVEVYWEEIMFRINYSGQLGLCIPCEENWDWQIRQECLLRGLTGLFWSEDTAMQTGFRPKPPIFVLSKCVKIKIPHGKIPPSANTMSKQ